MDAPALLLLLSDPKLLKKSVKGGVGAMLPVDRADDERDGWEADGRGGPLAHGQGQFGGAAQQVQRGGTHAVNGEARDDDGGQGLPHERVSHCRRHPRCLAWLIPVRLNE